MKNFLKSVGFAIEGMQQFFYNERNAGIQLLVAVIAIISGAVLKISSGQWLAIILCIAFVLALEMINSAIEKLCDLVTKDFHPGIKEIKDTAAGAVLIASILSLVTGLIIFIPKIYQLLIPVK